MPPGGAFPQQLEALRLWAGSPLPAGLRHRLRQEGAHVTVVTPRLAPLDAERRAVLQTAEAAAAHKGQQRLRLTGLGRNRAWGFVLEFCGWRAVRHRKGGGALSGLTPTP